MGEAGPSFKDLSELTRLKHQQYPPCFLSNYHSSYHWRVDNSFKSILPRTLINPHNTIYCFNWKKLFLYLYLLGLILMFWLWYEIHSTLLRRVQSNKYYCTETGLIQQFLFTIQRSWLQSLLFSNWSQQFQIDKLNNCLFNSNCYNHDHALPVHQWRQKLNGNMSPINQSITILNYIVLFTWPNVISSHSTILFWFCNLPTYRTLKHTI